MMSSKAGSIVDKKDLEAKKDEDSGDEDIEVTDQDLNNLLSKHKLLDNH